MKFLTGLADTGTVEVLVPVAVSATYSYAVPPHLRVGVGDLVRVPLGRRDTVGCVWSMGAGPLRTNRPLKPLEGRLDLPPLRQELRYFIDWVADYTVMPRGMFLRMALRYDPDHSGGSPRLGVRCSGVSPQRMTGARQRLLAVLADGLLHIKSEAAREAGVSVGVVDTLVDEGVLHTELLPVTPITLPLNPDADRVVLTPAQQEAADVLRGLVETECAAVCLLEGVTGSGKTEVYCEAVAAALRQKRQVLILLPEIALASGFVSRFEQRFGAVPGLWHSELSPRYRSRLWDGVLRGEVQVVIGARSALFLPFSDLGLIVVDEEHDPSYKQEEGICYHARDMAVVRARLCGCPLVLASATPSVETRVNVLQGRYRHVHLPDRYGGAVLPVLSAIDLRQSPPPAGRWISPVLVEEMRRTLEAGQQTLLFLNRRGYAPLTLCSACGYRMHCPHCSAWLVDHRFRQRLVCHHCGFSMARPDVCPSCEAPSSFVACGPGVERIASEASVLFPEARTVVMSSDVTGSLVRLQAELEAIAAGAYDLIIGTQLITKGHHFPKLALVGVIDADVGLGSGDPRAGERTFQMLHQVVGRAGRARVAGRGLIQTRQPDHPLLQALIKGDVEGFYSQEIEMRQQAQLPPFGRIAVVMVSGPDGVTTESLARRLVNAAPSCSDVRVLGPAQAPIAMIRGLHRFQILLRSPRAFALSAYLRHWLADAPAASKGVRIHVNVDPMGFV